MKMHAWQFIVNKYDKQQQKIYKLTIDIILNLTDTFELIA